MQKFSERLQNILDTCKVPKGKLAEVGGITPQTITSYLKDGSLPSQKTLAAWVKAYGLDAHWLLTGEGEMFPKGPGPGRGHHQSHGHALG